MELLVLLGKAPDAGVGGFKASQQGSIGGALTRRNRRSGVTSADSGPPPPRKARAPQVQPSALTAEERAAVLELMSGDEYVELAPAQAWARELDAGRYHCSVSTMYRILREKGQSGERRRQDTHPAKTVPELVAARPSQVFTWDITKAAGPVKGVWYHAYVIIDIFSRYIVGHTVEHAESAVRAEELIRETITRNGSCPRPCTQTAALR
ncbi:hypothetical protein [Streptomyces sp. NPDC054804]